MESHNEGNGFVKKVLGPDVPAEHDTDKPTPILPTTKLGFFKRSTQSIVNKMVKNAEEARAQEVADAKKKK